MTFMLRFMLQIVRADFHNPVSQFLIKVTNPLVKPVRRLLAGFGGIGGLDWSTLILAYILMALKVTLIFFLELGYSPDALVILSRALIETLQLVIDIYFYAILIQVILSWVNPGNYNPVVVVIQQLTAPIMGRIQRFVPPIGGLDLSPIFALLFLKLLDIWLIGSISGLLA
jgi:YggT family protein